jgi:hypothetical protein
MTGRANSITEDNLRGEKKGKQRVVLKAEHELKYL